MSPPSSARAVRLTVLCLWSVLGARPLLAAETAWSTLLTAREGLEVGPPRVARFRQTYLPSGFHSGDSEEGRLFLALPRCLRFEYETPYAKTYLLLPDLAFTWNGGDAVGRRVVVDAEREPGLDFLFLSVDRLAERYEASLEPLGDGAARVHLEALAGAGSLAVHDAELVLAPQDRVPVELSYRDTEGNLTRFTLSDYEVTSGDPCSVPDLQWEDASEEGR